MYGGYKFVTFKNNLNGFWDFYHGSNNVSVGSPKAIEAPT
jgi:hypothetical protein